MILFGLDKLVLTCVKHNEDEMPGSWRLRHEQCTVHRRVSKILVHFKRAMQRFSDYKMPLFVPKWNSFSATAAFMNTIVNKRLISKIFSESLGQRSKGLYRCQIQVLFPEENHPGSVNRYRSCKNMALAKHRNQSRDRARLPSKRARRKKRRACGSGATASVGPGTLNGIGRSDREIKPVLWEMTTLPRILLTRCKGGMVERGKSLL